MRALNWFVLLGFVGGCATPAPRSETSTENLQAQKAKIAAAAQAADPLWERGAFSLTPAELLAAGENVEIANEGVVVLFEEKRHRFDDNGRSSYRYRRIYKIVSQAGVEDWNAVGASWAPWYEKQPVIRARVVNPGGKSFELDPKTFEFGGGNGGGEVYSDLKRMRAPLPGITIGSMVEEETVGDETEPMFGAGTVSRYYFASSVPLRRTRLIVDAPAKLPLRFAAEGPDVPAAARVEKEGRVVVTYSGGPLAPIDDIPLGIPFEIPRVGAVGYSTGSSWNSVASHYAKLVRDRIGTPKLDALVKEARQSQDRTMIIRKLVARLHDEVRYTGIEFGESSIIPNSPESVLQRQFGDCKDKSLLLVSMLRAAGIKAHLALLNAGTSRDIDAGLPGFGVFNHAIVYVPELSSPWIDATARYNAVGDPPISVQGRLALVVDDATDGLVQIPFNPSTRNSVHEMRVFRLSEGEIATVAETTRSSGGEGATLRASYHGDDRKNSTEQLEKYMKGNYGGDKLDKINLSDPTAVDVPFEMHLESRAPSVAAVWAGGANVRIDLTNLFGFLPETLKLGGKKEHDEASKSSKNKTTSAPYKPRTVDFLNVRPFVYELETQIHPPPGYIPDRLPEKLTTKIGGATLTQESVTQADGTVTVRERFDSGPSRMTATEFETFKSEYQEFIKGEPIIVNFIQEGEAHLEAGRIQQALQSFRTLLKKHPNEPRLHAREARALLAAGLGAAARTFVDKALSRFPDSIELLIAKGWILEHDQIGMRHGEGFDFAKALEAYRAAIAIDPKNIVAQQSLGILLEHDAEGNRSYPEAQMGPASEAYKAVFEQDEHGTDVNYLLALMKANRWDDVLALVKKVGTSTLNVAAKLTAHAIKDGVAKALEESRHTGLNEEESAEALRIAGVELMLRRHYPEAAKLLNAAAAKHANGAGIRQLAGQLERLQKSDTWKSNGSPADVARAMGIAMIELAYTGNDKQLLSLMSTVEAKAWPEEIEGSPGQRKGFMNLVRKRFNPQGFPLAVLKDLSALSSFTVTGDEKNGYRVIVSAGGRNTDCYLQRENGRLVISGVGGSNKSLGRAARVFAERGDLQSARKWLDWAAGTFEASQISDPLLMPPLLRVWNVGFPASADTIKIAIATLGGNAKAEDNHDIFRACIAKPPSEQARLGCELSLFHWLMEEKKYSEAADVGIKWLEQFPESDWALGMVRHALSEAGRLDDAEKFLALDRKNRGQHPNQLRQAAIHADYRNDLRKSVALLTQLVKAQQAIPGDLNNLAWSKWVIGDAPAEAERIAREAVEKTNRSSSSSLNTLAAIVAERGRPDEALVLLHEGRRIDGGAITEADWLVVGLIAEAHGLPEEARSAYARLSKPKSKMATDTYGLAQKRLARLPK